MVFASVVALGFVGVGGAIAAEGAIAADGAKRDKEARDDAAALGKLLGRAWEEAFADRCTGDWRAKWFLDGKRAVVTSGAEGMTIDTAKGYAVLWTKQSFEGDLRIEYDFTRLDANDKGVNILYVQATGDGQNGCVEDIAKWSDRRALAAMSDYFQNMHTYHVSYATGLKSDYVRGRRYLPLANKGLKGTEIGKSYENTGLFAKPNEKIHVTVVKTPRDLFIRFEHPDRTMVCHFENADKPPIEIGRIGLRLMPSRKSRFENFRVFQPAKGASAGGEKP